VNDAGDACKAVAFSAAVTTASCTNGVLNDAGDACKTPTFVAADHTCIASDFGDKTKACCKAPPATPSSADDHADHDHSPSPAGLIDAASTISQASMVTALAMTIAYMLH
jgi:hypothetical protein